MQLNTIFTFFLMCYQFYFLFKKKYMFVGKEMQTPSEPSKVTKWSREQKIKSFHSNACDTNFISSLIIFFLSLYAWKDSLLHINYQICQNIEFIHNFLNCFCENATNIPNLNCVITFAYKRYHYTNLSIITWMYMSCTKFPCLFLICHHFHVCLFFSLCVCMSLCLIGVPWCLVTSLLKPGGHFISSPPVSNSASFNNNADHTSTSLPPPLFFGYSPSICAPPFNL